MTQGGPLGLPSALLPAFADLKRYDTAPTVNPPGGNTGYTTLHKPGASVYEKVIASTPGLVHWWGLDSKQSVTVGAETVGYRNQAGAAVLSVAAGTVTNVPGLLPGSRSGAAKLTSSAYLNCNDYFIQTGEHEILTLEMWIKAASFPADSALAGQWKTNSGWALLFNTSNGTLAFIAGSEQALSQASAIATGKTYHVVLVFGGVQNDYTTRLYLNGVQTATGSYTAAGTMYTTASQFEVGTYSSAAGGTFDCTYQHIAIYSRMLQPSEVTQHYQAAFARQ